MTAPAQLEAAREAAVARLNAYREAVNAARFLRGTFHEPPWLAGVGVEGDGEGGVRLVIALHWQTVMIRRCLPTKVNGIQVVVRSRP